MFNSGAYTQETKCWRSTLMDTMWVVYTASLTLKGVIYLPNPKLLPQCYFYNRADARRFAKECNAMCLTRTKETIVHRVGKVGISVRMWDKA